MLGCWGSGSWVGILEASWGVVVLVTIYCMLYQWARLSRLQGRSVPSTLFEVVCSAVSDAL